MKDFNKKMARFVELSKEFSVYEAEVYEGYSQNPNFIYAQDYTLAVKNSNSNYVTNNSGYITKQEQYEKYLLDKIEKVKRYEEYKILQADLSDYFEAVEKLSGGDENVEGKV